jgi:Kef-type K+ transport system membrane component KefB/nucleotide-binding universal stress UspA family protein
VSFELPELPFEQAGLVFAVLTVAILIAPGIARRLRLPDIVVVVLLGFAVGPTGLGLLERAGVVETLGTAGLLYLMFVAGLELDLDDFITTRRHSIGFGTLTFVIPMVLGTASALALGYPLLPSLLLASCWASHTLVTYPSFQRAGTFGNRAVATTVGATIITDTAALLVLAVVARASEGALTPVFWLTLLPSMAALTAGVVWGLPRLARSFFSGPGQDRNLRFLFVMVSLFVVASLAEVIGIEGIVGAFLAGLALNRSVPNGGALMERIDFLGASLFVPFFLLATGMLIDVAVLIEPRTLLVGGVFTLVAMVGKLLAAAGTGRLYDYGRTEVAAMFALSNAQAAATLAAVVVGLNVGLLDTDTVNAVMMVILSTCLVSSWLAGRVAPKLPRPAQQRDFGEIVVVPLANPASAPRLIRLASGFARADGGLVVPVLVSPSESDERLLERLRELDRRMLEVAQSAGAEARSVLRIDATPQLGISHTVVEQRASLLVLGWKGATARRGARFGGVIDGVLERTRVPTLVTYEGTEEVRRILVVIDESVMTDRGGAPLQLALDTARHTQRETGAPIEVLGNRDDAAVVARVTAELEVGMTVDERRRSILVKDRARATDVVILPTIGDEVHLRGVVTRVLKAVPAGASLLVAVAEVAPTPTLPTRAGAEGDAVGAGPGRDDARPGDDGRGGDGTPTGAGISRPRSLRHASGRPRTDR